MSSRPIRILAMEPYYGGSHKSFLDGWREHSSCEFTLLTLPAYKWKWRMRHGAVTFAEKCRTLIADGRGFDLVWASDMLDLATFVGLAPDPIRSLPRIAYFHENQLTYPVRDERGRDYQHAFTNFTTCLCASEVWFNSKFNHDAFLDALRPFFKIMPDHRPLSLIDCVRRKAKVFHPGIDDDIVPAPRKRAPGAPPRILWGARWEHDKNPEDFFEALRNVTAAGLDFRLNVIGESFRDVPPVFDRMRTEFADRIDRWGHQPTREEYVESLRESDLVVSTAGHEFFGIAIVEAVAAGVFPILPRRLAYPEVFATNSTTNGNEFFFDGSPVDLAEKLVNILTKMQDNQSPWTLTTATPESLAADYRWTAVAKLMDEAVANGTGR